MKPTFDLLLGLMGLRSARTAVTPNEVGLLKSFARGAAVVIEVGVAEGVTSAALLSVMYVEGTLFMVDPYPARLRVEQWMGFSGTRVLAKRSVKKYGRRAVFVPLYSVDAAAKLENVAFADFVFIDARHDYESVMADLRVWSLRVRPGGFLAVHDCIPCSTRPELSADTGACRAVAEFVSSDWRIETTIESLAVLRHRTAR